MEEYAEFAGRLLADRYRLPRPPSGEYELSESVAYDTASGQEVVVRQVPLPEVIDAELVEERSGLSDGWGAGGMRDAPGTATRRPSDPVVRRAVEAALAASRIPDHPRLDQVFDVFVEGDGLWIVSELVPGLPLASILAEQRLGPHRAAEIAADLLAALRTVHEYGWTHRNITARTVLICEDGRALLTGFAAGAAEEALCGYDPLPAPGTASSVPSGEIPESPPSSERDGVRGGEATGGPSGGGADGPPVPAALLGPRVPDARRAPAPWAGGALPEQFDDGAAGPAGGPGARGGRGGPPRTTGPNIAPHERDPDAPYPDDTGAPDPYAEDPYAEDPYGGEYPQDGRSDDPYAPNRYRSAPYGTDPYDADPYGTDPYDADPYGAERRGSGSGGGDGSPGRPSGGGSVRGETRYGPGRGSGAGNGDIFGFEGTSSGAPGEGASPHPSAPSMDRAARRGAIAAYREGTQRAAAEQQGGRQQGRQPEPPDHGRHPAEADGPARGSGQGETGMWAGEAWAAAPPGPGSDGLRPVGPDEGRAPSAPDDDVRWLPADGDTALPDAVDGATLREAERRAGPTAFPGARMGGSRTVHARWQPSAEGPGETGTEGPGGAGRVGGHGPDGPQLPDEYAEFRRPGATGEPAEFEEFDDEDGEADELPPWGTEQPDDGRYRGPTTALAAERARNARMTVVGPASERWAPEQAGPVYDNWRLAPPVGPAADLWALGVLLFRSVQGHAPYPEESTPELVQMVCAEPPAFAEDCGPLRPVVESLMRQDPTERPDFEELRGWLRSLIRSAPEPEAGRRTVTAPLSLDGGASDPKRLPIKRRRGDLVRRRRGAGRAARKESRKEPRRETRQEAAEAPAQPRRQPREKPPKEPRRPGPRRGGGERSPLRLGRLILGAVLLGLIAAVLYAVWFMPESDDGGQRQGSVGRPSDEGGQQPGDGADEGDQGGEGREDGSAPGTRQPQTTPPPTAPAGYTLREDDAGFQVAVPKGWSRHTASHGQVVYSRGSIDLVVVKGRDSAAKFGRDPQVYQDEKQRELAPFRTAGWSESTGSRRIDVGDQTMAEGGFSWQKDGDREMYARNRAALIDGRYHVLFMVGPDTQKATVDRHFDKLADTYRASGGD